MVAEHNESFTAGVSQAKFIPLIYLFLLLFSFSFFPNVVVTLSEYRKNARGQSNPTQRAEIFARFTANRAIVT